MNLKRLHVIGTIFHCVSASLKLVPEEVFGNFEFVTTRYSIYMGEFDESCDIVAPASILGPEENLCDLDTINTEVNGTILLQVAVKTLGCYPEVALANAESLGARVLLDVFPTTPGVMRYSRSLGQAANTESIPFLQTGTEFLVGVVTNPDLPIPINELVLELSGCNDESIWASCLNLKTAGVQIPTGMIALMAGIYGVKKSNIIPHNPSTKPRIYLLRYLSFTLFLAAFLFVFGYYTSIQYSWLTGSLFPDQVTNALASLMMAVQAHAILLTGIYWQALSSGLFKPHGKSTSYWSSHFYRHPLHYMSYPLLIFFIFGGYISVVTIFEDPERFEVFSYLLNTLQFIIAIFFLATGLSFIRKIREFIVVGTKSLDEPTTEDKRCGKCWSSVTSTVAAIKGTKFEKTSNVDRNVFLYTVWLTRCLLMFAFLMVTSYIPFPILYFDRLPRGTLQGQESACQFSTLMATCNLLKVLAICSLVSGIGWVSSKPIADTGMSTSKNLENKKQSNHSRKVLFISKSVKSELVKSSTDFPPGLPPPQDVIQRQPSMDILNPSKSRPSLHDVLEVEPGLKTRLKLKVIRSVRHTRASIKLFMKPEKVLSRTLSVSTLSFKQDGSDGRDTY